MDTDNSAQKDPTAVKTVFIVEDDEAIGALLVQVNSPDGYELPVSPFMKHRTSTVRSRPT